MSKVTIVKILGIIGAISGIFLVLGFLTGAVTIEQFVTEAAFSAIPEKVSVLLAVAGLGRGIGIVLILLVMVFWDKIANFDLRRLEGFFSNLNFGNNFSL